MASIFDDNKLDEIRRRIHRLSPDTAPCWGKMNVSQMMCHLADGIKIATGERPLADTSSFFSRTILKFIVLYLIKIPKGVPTVPELDQMKDGTPPDDYEHDRAELLRSIEYICSLPENFDWFPHPKFGPMDKRAWGILAYKHIDHHLRQFGV